jgi:hypothetical protein
MPQPYTVYGTTAAGFEAVEREFHRNFVRRSELGAACAVYYRGERVVDLWGGWRDTARQFVWEQDTLVPVFSTTKGIAALTMALAHSRGLYAYDEKVSTYWSEFAQNGKADITVRQLLSVLGCHQRTVLATQYFRFRLLFELRWSWLGLWGFCTVLVSASKTSTAAPDGRVASKGCWRSAYT